MVNANKKGKNFELEISKDLAKKFGYEVRRTPNSGGIQGFMRQDIVCMNDKSILNEYFMELKKQESLNAHKVYWRTEDVSPKNKIPIVIWKKNRDPEPVVVIGYEDFCNALLELEELRREKWESTKQ